MTAGSDPLQLILGVDQPHNNQYLFSDHYLENLLPEDPRWEAVLQEAGSFLTWLQELYLAEGDQLAGYNESQLEDHWFRPVLEKLGHVCEGQASIPGLQRGIKRPDYVFFQNEPARQAAVRAQGTKEYAADALAAGEVKAFVQEQLFDQPVELDSPNTLRNLSEIAATKTLIETFKRAINARTIQDKGDAEIRDTIKLRLTRPFVARDQSYLVPKKSVFNRIIGDGHFELMFASFLEDCSDVVSYAKNYLAVHFKLDYVNADGDISNYYPDFLVKLSNKRIIIVETKGQEDLDVPLKMQRLRQWCEDINQVQSDVQYDFVYVDQENFERHKPTSFMQLAEGFKEYKEKI